MAIVGTVLWDCPGCNTKNEAQIHDDTHKTYHYSCIPYGSYLSWNPPCIECEKFRLIEPNGNISLGIENVINND